MHKKDLEQLREISRYWAYEWLSWNVNDQANYLGEGVMVDDLVPIALDNGVLTIIRPATARFNEMAVFYEVKSAAKKFGSELIAVEWLDATPIELHLAKALRRQGL